jgi:hypothetical protein
MSIPVQPKTAWVGSLVTGLLMPPRMAKYARKIWACPSMRYRVSGMALFEGVWAAWGEDLLGRVRPKNHCSLAGSQSLLQARLLPAALFGLASVMAAVGAPAAAQQGTPPAAGTTPGAVSAPAAGKTTQSETAPSTMTPAVRAGDVHWLGVWLRAPKPGEAAAGLIVEWVAAGGPADGRIQPGDQIIDMDGQETRTMEAARAAIERREWDDGLALTLRRRNRVLSIMAYPAPAPALRPFPVSGHFTGERYTGDFEGFLDPVAHTAVGSMQGRGAGSVDVTFSGPWNADTGAVKLALKGHVRVLFTVSLHGIATGTVDASGKGSGHFEGASGLGSERGDWDCSNRTSELAEL